MAALGSIADKGDSVPSTALRQVAKIFQESVNWLCINRQESIVWYQEAAVAGAPVAVDLLFSTPVGA